MDELRKPTEAQKKAYDAGARAFRGGGEKAKNPHAEGSDVAKYWEHGFLDAQKASATADKLGSSRA
ncbi:hypothetical protein AB4Z52_17355 [Rhizobium sp. 2YAF20]|uniref:ribosome modulation factor n=1 Tax=Rhizobium sp. 2YAF20 TaxID=3233027 RepID=UPI003F9B9485